MNTIYEYKYITNTNIGLADTLIPSSCICFIYMQGTVPYDSIKIIFGNHAYS